MLRAWRRRRRYSQLALALDAEISARHLSFVETGRSAPSREMLLHLADHLQIPYRERNALLLAAGYAPEYGDRSFGDPALADVRRAVDLLLAGLEPCPALAVDRRWTLLAGNRAMHALTVGVEPSLLEPPVNVLRVSLHPEGLAPRIANLAAWRGHVLNRLRRDVEHTGDAFLTDLLEEIRAYPLPATTGDTPGPTAGPTSGDASAASDAPPADGLDPAVAVPLRIRTGAGELSFISTTTVFGSAVDVTVAELAVESFLPADEATAQALQALAAGATAPV
jgi:transcriptional regulator with XRE-family HTH domain